VLINEDAEMNGDPRKSPALEALDMVRKAEEQAKAIIREARERTAVQIAKEAAEAVEEIRQDSLAKAKEEAEVLKKDIVERARREAEAIRGETQAELVAQRRQAEAVLDEAVKKVGLKIREFLREGSS
jgi:vacuolar-type H+-ATPase subunit H